MIKPKAKNSSRVSHKHTVPNGESMSRFLGKLIKHYRIGERVEVWFKGKRYTWEKKNANTWSKVKENPDIKLFGKNYSFAKLLDIAKQRKLKSFYIPQTLLSDALHYKATTNTAIEILPAKDDRGINIILAPKRKNSGASDFKQFQKKRLAELSTMFQGHHNGQSIKSVMQPDAAPKVNKYLLGHLVQMKVKNGTKTTPINFDGEAYLSGDIRNNLWAVGKDARIQNLRNPGAGKMQYLGKLIQIDYVTSKSHIEPGKTVRFYHELGEVDGEYPELYMDADKFPIIVGGGYDCWSVGIVN